MFNVCIKCGEYRPDKEIDLNGPYAVCPNCGHAHKFTQLPLFIITGASGVGKTSICIALTNILSEAIVLEGDILWRNEFNNPDNDYREYRDMWLRVCKNISQSGKPVVLCGSAIPEQFENCTERRYFSNLHYLALVCEDGMLSNRLKARPNWRESGSEEFIKGHIQFNNWFKQNGDKITPRIDTLDTTFDSVEATAEKIKTWILEKL